jgi:hypothetical protein
LFNLTYAYFIVKKRQKDNTQIRQLCVVCLRTVMSNTYCVLVLVFFVLCTLYYQFLWIVHFWLPLRCSLTSSLLLSCLKRECLHALQQMACVTSINICSKVKWKGPINSLRLRLLFILCTIHNKRWSSTHYHYQLVSLYF